MNTVWVHLIVPFFKTAFAVSLSAYPHGGHVLKASIAASALSNVQSRRSAYCCRNTVSEHISRGCATRLADAALVAYVSEAGSTGQWETSATQNAWRVHRCMRYQNRATRWLLLKGVLWLKPLILLIFLTFYHFTLCYYGNSLRKKQLNCKLTMCLTNDNSWLNGRRFTDVTRCRAGFSYSI